MECEDRAIILETEFAIKSVGRLKVPLLWEKNCDKKLFVFPLFFIFLAAAHKLDGTFSLRVVGE